MFSVLRRRYGGRRSRNLLKNSIVAGAIAGTPGTLPRSWTSFLPDSAAGITTSIAGPISDSGMDCIDWRVNGTPNIGGGVASFRSSVAVSYGSRTNTTINAPFGATTGDLLVMLLLIVPNVAGSAPAVTPPAGWTDKGSPGSYTDSGGFQGVWHIFIKPATASEPLNYTSVHTIAFTEVELYCVTGGDSSAFIFGTNLQNTGTTISYNSLTTTRNSSVIIAWGVCWNSPVGATAPAGATPTFSLRDTQTVTTVSDGVLTTAGATGAKTVNVTNSNVATFGLLVGVQPTPTGTAQGTEQLFFSGAQDIFAVNNDKLAESVYLKLIAGSMSNASIQLQINLNNSAGTFLSNINSANLTPTASFQRFTNLITDNQATSAFAMAGLAVNYTAVMDLTLRIGLPQLERGSVVSPAERRLVV